MTLKWIRRWARFLDVKLRLDHTLSQSTDKLRSDNSLFQIVLIERGFVIQSIILLYIKETDGRPADGAIQSRIGWEEWKKTKERHTLWEQNVIEEKQNMQMLVDKIWLSMPEMNRGPGYHTYHPHVFTPKEDQEGWTNGRFPHTKLKLCHKGVLLQNLKGPPIRHSTVFQILIELATTGPNL